MSLEEADETTFLDMANETVFLDASILATTRLLRDVAALAALNEAAAQTIAAIRAGGKLLVCGNGGSAADAQHIATEFVVRLAADRPALPAMALTVDSSIMTAAANDYAFDRIFARQIEAIGKPGDVLLAISTSGRSANVLAAARTARAAGLRTVGLTGAGGGEMATACEVVIHVPSSVTAIIQQLHITLAHILCAKVERAFFPA